MPTWSSSIPARGLLGLRTRLLSATQGEAIMHHNFHEFRPFKGEIPRRPNGVMISNGRGQAVAFALDGLQQRGTMFVEPGDDVYEGMIVAEHARDNDLVVNPTKEKKLTNMRASGSDKNILLKPPRELTLEIALEYIEDDELVEVTPSKIRLRKKELSEEGRKRSERQLQGPQEGRRGLNRVRGAVSYRIARITDDWVAVAESSTPRPTSPGAVASKTPPQPPMPIKGKSPGQSGIMRAARSASADSRPG